MLNIICELQFLKIYNLFCFPYFPFFLLPSLSFSLFTFFFSFPFFTCFPFCFSSVSSYDVFFLLLVQKLIPILALFGRNRHRRWATDMRWWWRRCEASVWCPPLCTTPAITASCACLICQIPAAYSTIWFTLRNAEPFLSHMLKVVTYHIPKCVVDSLKG
jgi:hypothetical protein